MNKKERKFMRELAALFDRESVRVEAREHYDGADNYVGTQIVFVHEDGTEVDAEDLATICDADIRR